MPSHRSHGFPYVEPPRHDELPDGVVDNTPARAGRQHRPGGRFETDNAETKALAAKGGRSRKATTKLSHGIDAPKLTPESGRRARTLRKTLSNEIATTVGGGFCGVAASLMIKWAAQKTAAAEEAFARGDYEAHRKLSESARMDLLYAREHAAKEATARADARRNAPFLPPSPRPRPPPKAERMSPDEIRAIHDKARELGIFKKDENGT